jgi:hypothetical protein
MKTCECSCGEFLDSSLYKGRQRRFVHGHNAVQHGCAGTPEWIAWNHIIQRCTNPNCREWRNYGARGITICSEWRHDFPAFLAHIGHRPTSKHSIERIHNDGNYEPGNVCWATQREQTRNTRRNLLITFNGQTKCIRDWAREFGINHETLRHRIVKMGLSMDRAIGKRPQ